jgi:hypothetical protein
MLKETAAALGAALAIASCAAAQNPAPPAAPEVSEAQVENLPPSFQIRCETSCSQTEPGVVLAWLTWIPVPEDAPAAANAAPAAEFLDQRLDVTVFKDGFADGRYATFETAGATGLAAGADAGGVTPRVFGPRVEAYGLQITAPEQSEEDHPLGIAPANEPSQEQQMLLVERLEPGIYYTWRLLIDTPQGWTVSRTVTCQAPVCPADKAKED